MSAVLLDRSAFIRSCVRRSQRLYRLLVVLAVEVFLNELLENPSARDAREQRSAGAQLHVIRSSKDIECGAPGDAVDDRRALLKSRTQNGMIEIRARLSGTLDRILTRHRAEPETLYLREDVPHPMGPLVPLTQLGKRLVVVRRLRAHETLEVVRIAG